ncbi:pyridoxamine 5-phosphate oxidase [Actinomycetospora sp. TBRC 11914]|nr:pyridoxamine 5-phosphate oxidase [Actinomycetospora sp. TBRC 11914]
MCDRLLPTMTDFIGGMTMMFVATADRRGECDSSLRAGPEGFVTVLDDRHVAYPEYRGNGVMASLGNIAENPHVGLLMIDFSEALIGLHVNGSARVVADADLRLEYPELPTDGVPGRRAQVWVVVEVEEAYIHCRKHIPRLVPAERNRSWGTDAVKAKGGDYFGAAARHDEPVRTGTEDETGSPAEGRPEVPADPVAERTGAGAAS